MLDEKNIRELVNNLCFDLDCVHFNAQYSTTTNITNLREWLSGIVDEYEDVLRDDEIGAANRKETDWGEAHLTYEKLVTEIEAFDKEPVPEFDRQTIKDVYVGLVSFCLHPKVLRLANGGLGLQDNDLSGYLTADDNDGEQPTFKEVTAAARNRAFIEDMITKYKPASTEDLYQLFDSYPNGMAAITETVI